MCIGGENLFYFTETADQTREDFEERVGNELLFEPQNTRRIEVDLPRVIAQTPTYILEYNYGDQKWHSLFLQMETDVAAIQRDWNDVAKPWHVCGSDPQGKLVYYTDLEDGNWLQSEFYDFIGSPATCLMPDTTSDIVHHNNLYAAGANMFHIHTAQGVYSPTFPWQHVQVDENADIKAIDIRPDGADTILIANDGIGAWRSTNRGAALSWSAINSGLSCQDAFCIKYCPGQSNIALIGTAGGLFKSANVNSATPTWSAANYGASTDTVVAIDFHADSNSIVLRSTRDDSVGTTYISADTARSWIEINTGLSDLVIHDIASDIDNPDTFYVATDDGVYKLKNPVKSGTISSPGATWGPGLVIVNGDVTVESDATLTIEEGTKVLFVYDFDKNGGGASSAKSELIVEGSLIAEGDAEDSILFISSLEPLGDAEPGDWYGIRLMPGSEEVVMEYCAVRYAEYGVYMDSSSDATLSSCLISRNDHSGLYVKEADLDLDSSVVTFNDYGVNITYDGYADIDDCDIGHNAVTGVWNHPGKLNMRGCTLESNGLIGIYGWRSIDTVYTTTISEEKYGIYWMGEDEAVIDSCVITCTGSTGSYYGIYARKEGTANPDVYVRNDSIANFPQGGIYFNQISSDGIIRNTDVVSCGTYGVYYQNSSTPISGGEDTKNLFYDNTYGFYLTSSSSPSVRRTHFKDNLSRGAKVGFGCSPEFGLAADSGFNSFTTTNTGLLYKDLDNPLSGRPVYAIGNWWGEDPPDRLQIVGAVYEPFLTSDPLPAKIAPELDIESLPQDFSVARVYPNPFNPTTVIKFSLSSPQNVTVRIYNILGQEVKLLIDGPMPAGHNTVVWDGRNAKGEYVSSGIYLCQMRTAERQKTLKMTVLR